MKRVILTAGLCALASLPALAGGPRDTVVSTAAYAWVGDSIVQGEYKAYAVSEEEITAIIRLGRDISCRWSRHGGARMTLAPIRV